jgi:hypothetical protein
MSFRSVAAKNVVLRMVGVMTVERRGGEHGSRELDDLRAAGAGVSEAWEGVDHLRPCALLLGRPRGLPGVDGRQHPSRRSS